MASVEIVEQYPRLVDFVLSDHVHVHVLYKQLVAAMQSSQTALTAKICNAIMLLVRQHSQAELDVLYPAMESDLGPMGERLSKKAIDEHAQVETMVKQALEAGVDSKEAAKLVKDFCDVRCVKQAHSGGHHRSTPFFSSHSCSSCMPRRRRRRWCPRSAPRSPWPCRSSWCSR